MNHRTTVAGEGAAGAQREPASRGYIGQVLVGGAGRDRTSSRGAGRRSPHSRRLRHLVQKTTAVTLSAQLLTEGGGSAKVGQHSFGNNCLICAAWR